MIERCVSLPGNEERQGIERKREREECQKKKEIGLKEMTKKKKEEIIQIEVKRNNNSIKVIGGEDDREYGLQQRDRSYNRRRN